MKEKIMIAWLKIPIKWRTYIVSAFDTFVTTFVTFFLIFLSQNADLILNPSAWSKDAVTALLLTAVRTAFKAARDAAFPSTNTTSPALGSEEIPSAAK